MMKKGGMIILVVIAVVGLAVLLSIRRPIILGTWTKQTLYLWWLNCWYQQSKDAEPTAMLIDDDCGVGIYKIKEICDELSVKATFAVIPSRIDNMAQDSLRRWLQEGYGIALHGYNHEIWKGWTVKEVVDDLEKSIALLTEKGIHKEVKYVVPPHGCNTSAIRNAIRQSGYKMVTGANIVNPDTTKFLYGRVFITKDADLVVMKALLEEAKKKGQFVIFGTHSSMLGEFSENKTKEVIRMTKELGFRFI